MKDSGCLGEAATRCHEVIDDHRCACRDRSSQPKGASQILLPGPRPQTCLIGNWSSLHKDGPNRCGVLGAETTGSCAGHCAGRVKSAPAYGPGCRRDLNKHNSRGVRPVRQQGVHAHRQPFGQDSSQDQRLSLLVRVDQSAQELVVRGGGDCQREAVWPRRRDGQEWLSSAELLATRRAESPPGLLATVALGAEQQVARSRCPVLKAHRASLAGRELSGDERSPICGQSPRRVKFAGAQFRLRHPG